MIKNCNYNKETGMPHQVTQMTSCDCGAIFVCPFCSDTITVVECTCKDGSIFRPELPNPEEPLVLGVQESLHPVTNTFDLENEEEIN